MITELFLAHSTKTIERMTGYIDQCLDRLTEDETWHRGSGPENSVGNLVLHLCGNLGQWIGTYVAGRPDVRDRPVEFTASARFSRDELKAKLRASTSQAIKEIGSVTEARLSEPVTTQDSQTTILSVIYQVVGHFQQHTGQIMFATKLLRQEDLELYRAPNPPAERTP